MVTLGQLGSAVCDLHIYNSSLRVRNLTHNTLNALEDFDSIMAEANPRAGHVLDSYVEPASIGGTTAAVPGNVIRPDTPDSLALLECNTVVNVTSVHHNLGRIGRT